MGKLKNNLTIHHKDGKGFAVSKENRNNNINNLITLCEKCHNSIESNDIKIEDYVNRDKLLNITSIKAH
jgi:5-methylcytosine-specific restriction endonuclease McrA